MIFVTFQTTEGKKLALKTFGPTRDRQADKFNLVFRQSPSPHSFEWENLHTPRSYRIKAYFLFSVFVVSYMILIYFVMDVFRLYFEQVRFNYVWQDQCSLIQS
jgi:hypothetical protein